MWIDPEPIGLAILSFFLIIWGIARILEYRETTKQYEKKQIAEKADAEYKAWKKERGL